MVTGKETVDALDGQWHKILILVMRKQGLTHVVLTPKDLIGMIGGTAITAQEKDDGLHLRVVDALEAERLAQDKRNHHRQE